MYKFKTYNYYNNLILNYNLLYLDNLIKLNLFIIFFNYNKLTNYNLLILKNEIEKEDCISLTLNRNYINKMFSNYFTFLSSYIFCIFINNYIKFKKIINILNNINFFYSYKKRFSNIVNKNLVLNQLNFNLQYLHYITFKILFNILILLLYIIISILKFIK
jgi:hypothetical protein